MFFLNPIDPLFDLFLWFIQLSQLFDVLADMLERFVS